MRYKINEKFYHAILDEEICLFDPEKGKYHNLNKVGTSIWEILNNSAKIDKIIKSLMDKYEVTEEQCYSETKEFLDIAVKKKIILIESNN